MNAKRKIQLTAAAIIANAALALGVLSPRLALPRRYSLPA